MVNWHLGASWLCPPASSSGAPDPSFSYPFAPQELLSLIGPFSRSFGLFCLRKRPGKSAFLKGKGPSFFFCPNPPLFSPSGPAPPSAGREFAVAFSSVPFPRGAVSRSPSVFRPSPLPCPYLLEKPLFCFYPILKGGFFHALWVA